MQKMISLVNNREFIITTNSKLIFNEKIKYISEILEKTKTDFTDNEEELEEEFWNEYIIQDQTDLSNDDFEFYTELLESYKDKHKHLPQILYKSLIVSIYSIIETTLSELIKATEKNVNKKIKYKHLKNNGNEVENYLNFFNLIHDLELTNIQDSLNEIKNYADIRNNIVHFNGNLKGDNEGRKSRITKFVKNNKAIEIEPNGNLFIKDCQFVFDFLDLTNRFSYILFENYKIENKH
jgi:hypothetical protein